jgi:hypothetical protein
MGETDERHDILCEAWVPDGNLIRAGGDQWLESHGTVWREVHIRAELAAAAPALVRALLWSEWGVESRASNDGTQVPSADPEDRSCPGCGYRSHDEGCRIDAALTSAGFPDEASRKAAREFLERAGR